MFWRTEKRETVRSVSQAAITHDPRPETAHAVRQFEGIARKQMLTFDGTNRDNAWFAFIDDDWPAVKARLEAMLAR